MHRCPLGLVPSNICENSTKLACFGLFLATKGHYVGYVAKPPFMLLYVNHGIELSQRDAGFSTLHVNLCRLLMADGRVLATRGGRCHPTERQDAASGPTPAGEQPVMSLCPLRIRREHLRRLCGRPLWAEPTEGFDRSIGWSGSAKALDDWRDQYHGHGRKISRTSRRSLGISSRDRSRVRNG